MISLLKVLIHGYTGSSEDDAWQEMAEAFMVYEPANIIRVDWRHGAGGIGADVVKYWYAVANTMAVGAQIAFFLRRLVEVKLNGQ